MPESDSLGKRIWLMLWQSIQQWLAQRGQSKGAAVAFYALFSLAPIFFLVIAIGGAIFDSSTVRETIFKQLVKVIGPSSSDAIHSFLFQTYPAAPSHISTVIATIALIIGTTSIFTELKASLDEIWEVPMKDQGGFIRLVRTRILSFCLVLIFAFLLLLSIAFKTALTMLGQYWMIWENALISSLSSMLSFAALVSLFAAIYKMLPEITLSWNDVWVGALATAGLFSIGKYAIGVYLGNSSVISGYGAAGSFVALLLWVYYSSQIFFLGAEITHQYAEYFGSLRNRAEMAHNHGGKPF